MNNSGLALAKAGRKDEFYTQLSDIQAELKNYSDKFKDKVVFCNCDDPFESNFVKYFLMNSLSFLSLRSFFFFYSSLLGVLPSFST